MADTSPPAYDDPDSPAPATATTLAAAGGARFPMTFNMYSHTKQLKHTMYTLGEHKSTPLYLVAWHSKWSGKTSLTLHPFGGSSATPAWDLAKTASPLASAESTSAWTQTSTLTLCPPPGPTEKLNAHTHLTSVAWSFVLAVPVRPGSTETYPEKFEWRQSHGPEVRGAAGDKRVWGYKLVRLASSVGGGEREVGGTSDGKEVVAVWADYLKMSWTKLACFRFCGSGATGELGEEWTLMAVLSVLRLWQVTTAQVAASRGGV